MAKRWGFTAALVLAWVGAGALALGGNPAQPAKKKGKRAKTPAAQAQFQDTFNVDKTALLSQGANTYMILDPGYKLILADGKDTLTITVLNETKMVDGVPTRIVEERETKGGNLEEISRNYFAFDKTTGNIYYFGEDVNTYDAQGKVTGHEGSWLAGVNDARFGLMMPGKPQVGARFYQEIAPGVAMDRAEIVSLSEKVKTPAGTFQNCLKTRESSSLEAGTEEKLYAPGVGLLKDGGFELAKVEKPEIKLPEAVAKTFQAAFPQGQITKLDMDVENSVTVYDIEFTDGTTEKETDITADGTMLEYTVVITAKEMPPAARKAVRTAAQGAKMGRVERVEIAYETKDGKVVKLGKPVTRYEVEFVKNGETSEIVVNPDGIRVIEPEESGLDAKK